MWEVLFSVICIGSSFSFIIIFYSYVPFNKYLLSICYAPSIISNDGDVAMTQTDKLSALREP